LIASIVKWFRETFKIDDLTREEAAQFLLERRLEVRYTPFILDVNPAPDALEQKHEHNPNRRLRAGNADQGAAPRRRGRTSRRSAR
jgi:hypothetical protein